MMCNPDRETRFVTIKGRAAGRLFFLEFLIDAFLLSEPECGDEDEEQDEDELEKIMEVALEYRSIPEMSRDIAAAVVEFFGLPPGTHVDYYVPPESVWDGEGELEFEIRAEVNDRIRAVMETLEWDASEGAYVGSCEVDSLRNKYYVRPEVHVEIREGTSGHRPRIRWAVLRDEGEVDYGR